MAGREGTTFGAYRLTRRLAAGAAGEVYLAEGPTATGSLSQVAVKVITGTAADPTTREVARQAQAAGELRQPHIIPLHGIVQHGDALGVAMAFAPGGSLGDSLAARRPDGSRKVPLPLAAPVAARLVLQLARALEAAHAAGLVHGDIKPNNVFVRTSPGGAPLAALGDFGQSVLMTMAAEAARAPTTDPDHLAWAGAQLVFAAPEQLQGRALPASDQYALAALAYLLLTGEPPLVGDAPTLLRAIPIQAITAPSELNGALPAELDAVLLRALAKDPAQRFPSVAAFAEALDHVLALPAVVVQQGGVTQAFANLSGSHPALRRPTDAPGASGSALTAVTGAIRLHNMTAAATAGTSASTRQPPPLVDLPVDTPPGINRRLALIVGGAMALVVAVCVLAFSAASGAALLPRIQLGSRVIAPSNTAAPRPNATATAQAHAAAADLQAARARGPVFQDKLTAKNSAWHTDGSAIFFSADGLHLYDANAGQPTLEDAPGAAAGPYSSEVVHADVTIVRGKANNFAGIRFLTAPDGSYYAYLISPEGKFELWRRASGWDFITTGFVPQLKTGLGATNTLDVLVQPDASGLPVATLFANGQLVARAELSPDGPGAGGAGLIVLDSDTEAAFANFAVYGPNS